MKTPWRMHCRRTIVTYAVQLDGSMAAPGNTGGRGLRDLEGIGKGHEKRLIGHGIFTVNALQQRILSKTTEDARLAEFKVRMC